MKAERINLMCDNLYWRLRKWILNYTSDKCIVIWDLCEKVYKYAPKTIKNDKEAYTKVVNMLWNVAHDYSIDSVDFLRKELNDELDYYFPSKINNL